MPLAQAKDQRLVEEFDPAPPYLGRIQSLVHLPTIQNAGLKVMVDAMFGAGAGYLPKLIAGGRTTVEELHGVRNPAFPGMEQPEPIAHNLTELAECLRAGKASVGLALDGDADRVGLLDEAGNFVTTLQVFSLLALYLLEQKGERGAIVKGVTSSSMLNQLGEKFGVAVHEMPVGFKHIGPKFTEADALMGGEESGGFAFRGHIPERDGILSALYLLEFMARTGKSPGELVHHLFDQVGPHYYHRRDVTFNPAHRQRILERLNSKWWTELGGMPIRHWDRIDGRRLMLDKAWLAARFSGTEPLLRIYCEADRPETVQKLLDAAAEYLGV
jgi:phosphomannomutase